MLVFSTNLSLMEFQVRYLAFFLLFSVIDGLKWFLKSSQEYPVNAGVPEGFILGPTVFLYTVTTFLMLSMILLSMLMILLSIVSVIRHLICDSNLNWLLNFNLICETLWTGAKSDLLILMLEKLNWFCLTSLITLVLLM